MAAVGGGMVSLWLWLRRGGETRLDGEVAAPGAEAPIAIRRDRWGVPHVRAESLADAQYALGYVHAQDRLWQMEVQRRVTAGRLAEAFGERGVEADRFMRRVGIRRAAVREVAALDPEEQRLGEAYCRGVNDAIAAMGSRLPPEFRIVGLRPEAWTLVDSIAWGKAMGFFLSHNWDDELVRGRVLARVGPEATARLDPHYPAGHPVATRPDGPGAENVAAEALRLLEAAAAWTPLTGPGASNNWVVAGSRTASGRPILANDPHLTLQVPSLWYEAHLASPEADVVGVTLPGVPGVVIGHNERVGWGYTDSYADCADLYVERYRQERAEVEYEGRFEAVRVHREVIRVRGGEDVVEVVHETRHGPVIARDGATGLALRWSGHEPGHIFRALLGMNTARDAAAFRESLRDWPEPSLNMVFADVDGNMGYAMAGRVPVRARGQGYVPVPGWNRDHEWTGWIPFDELPHLWNPPGGIIATANNKVVGSEYKHHISWDFMMGDRVARILDVLRSTTAITPDDCRRLQMDVKSAPGLAFAAACRRLAPTDEFERAALDRLLAWDGHLTTATVGGTVYHAALHHAVRLAYGPVLGDLIEDWLGKPGHPVMAASTRAMRAGHALLRELAGRDASFFRLPGARVPEAPDAYADPWDTLLAAALGRAVAELRERYGNDLDRWAWGEVHRMRIHHPLAGAAVALRNVFRGIDVPIGGDTSTPLQTAYVPAEPYEGRAWAPSFRMVLDFADLARAGSVNAGGQSGHPRSRNYLDQVPLWSRGDLKPMLYAEDEIAKEAVATLRLVPPGSVR